MPIPAAERPLPFAARLYQLCGGSEDVSLVAVRETLEQEYAPDVLEKNASLVAQLVEYSNLFRLHSEPTVANWFLKKPESTGAQQKRFFELRDNTVYYFANCNAKNRGVDSKGSFEITSRTHLERRLRNLLIHNPDRTYDLTAESDAIAIKWMDALEASKLDATQEETTAMALTQRFVGRSVAANTQVRRWAGRKNRDMYRLRACRELFLL